MRIGADMTGDLTSSLATAPVIREAPADSPVVLLHNHPRWEAQAGFSAELAGSLARQTECETLLVNLDAVGNGEIRNLTGSAGVCDLALLPAASDVRSDMARRLTAWKSRFANIILNPMGPDPSAVAAAIEELANWHCHLLGPGDEVPPDKGEWSLTVQSAAAPTMPVLNGRNQLIFEAVESEAAWHGKRAATRRFRRTVDSIARAIAGMQVVWPWAAALPGGGRT